MDETRLRLTVTQTMPTLIRALVEAGVDLVAVYPVTERLEAVYMASVSGART